MSSTSPNYYYRKVFGRDLPVPIDPFPFVANDTTTFERAVPSTLRNHVLMMDHHNNNDAAATVVDSTSAKLSGLRPDQYIALTWIALINAPPRNMPVSNDEWDVYEETCRNYYYTYEKAYNSASKRVRAKMPAPDYELFTNNSDFTNTLFTFNFHKGDAPTAVEFGPYIVRNIFPLATAHVPSFAIEYYDPELKGWIPDIVEDRAILRHSGLRRTQQPTDDIRYDSMYTGHGFRCSTCGLWWQDHGPRQCLPCFDEEMEGRDSDDEDEVATILLLSPDDDYDDDDIEC